MSLLEKAKALPRGTVGRRVDREAVEIAVAWFRGEVTDMQCVRALGLKGGPSSVRYHFARALREGVIAGMARIVFDADEVTS